MPCAKCREDLPEREVQRLSRRKVLMGAVTLSVAARALQTLPVTAQDATPEASRNALAGVPEYIPEPESEILMPIEGPLTPETVTFRVLMMRSDEITDYEDNAFTNWLEEKTNVHVQWDLVPEDDIQSKLNVMLASGDVPDIIFGTVNLSQLQLYGSQGMFLPLNDLIAQHGPRATRLMEIHPVVRDVITGADGSIYAMPGYGVCYHCTMNQKLWLYKPWLDKLGLKVPTTTDELEAVLKAFKEQDPNGNGEVDEIPLSGSLSEANMSLPTYLMNSFIYYPGPMVGEAATQPRNLIVLDGKVTPIYATEQWREGLRYINRLYTQGLIDPQILTQDEDQLQRIGSNPDTVILGGVLGGSPGSAVSLDTEDGKRWADYVPVPPVAGPEGVRYAAWNPYLPAFAAATITRACKDPALAVAWVDTMLFQEATIREDRGVLGEDWRWAEEGELDVTGEQALWKILVVHTEPSNHSWVGAGPIYFSLDMFSGVAVDPNNFGLNIEKILYDTTHDLYEPYKQPGDMTLPPLAFTNDQALSIADPEATIGQYFTRMMAEFIRGDTDLDAGWDTYIQTLDQMGLAPYIQVYQDAYDAKKAQQ